MLLREVSLYLDTVAFDGRFGSEFDFRAYHIADFITRQIRPLRFESSEFSGIVIRCCPPEHPMDCKVQGDSALVVDVPFDRGDYEDLTSERDFQEFVIGLLLRGVGSARQNHDLPYDQIKEAVEEFRRAGYKNEWVHAKRLFRGTNGLRGWLKCKMDSQKFTLILRLERKGSLLYESEILETEPDALFFHHMFKDLVLDGDKLVVTRPRSRILLELDLNQLESSSIR